MIKKERLLEISELNIAEKIKQMNDDDLKNYSELLNSFTESFPEYEEKIRSALTAKDYDALTEHLTAVHDILEKISADDSAKDCLKCINDGFDSSKHEKIEAFLNYLLSTLSMLSIDIQMLEQNTDKPASELEKSPVNMTPVSDKKILAVDDTPFFLTMLKTTLQDTKYKLTCVASGKDALKYLEKNSPNLFLLDIEMPGMDGYELAARIKENGQKAPIVFLTGNAKKESVTRAMKAGAADFILKPINKYLLLAKIAKNII